MRKKYTSVTISHTVLKMKPTCLPPLQNIPACDLHECLCSAKMTPCHSPVLSGADADLSTWEDSAQTGSRGSDNRHRNHTSEPSGAVWISR